jgi:small subunit ribosomal protein S3
MAQKVNPISFRILNNKNSSWQSVWHDNSFSYKKKLLDDINIRNFIYKNYSNCGIGGISIERQSDKVMVVIKTSKPGVIIGKKGFDIEKISSKVKSISKSEVDIKILEIKSPDLNSMIVGDFIAKQLENRASFKRVIKKAIQSTIKAGSAGIKIMCSGRLGGAEIARSESYKEGTIPLHTLRSNIDYATSVAHTTYGAIGIKVWINKG